MRPALRLVVLSLAISWAGPLQAASPGRNGNLVRLDVHVYSTLPPGSLVVCKVQLIAEPGPPGEGGQRLDPAPAAEGSALLQGASGDCRVEVPLCWTGNGLASGITLRYEIDAKTRSGAPPVVLRRGALSVPAGNAAAAPTLTLSLGAAP